MELLLKPPVVGEGGCRIWALPPPGPDNYALLVRTQNKEQCFGRNGGLEKKVETTFVFGLYYTGTTMRIRSLIPC